MEEEFLKRKLNPLLLITAVLVLAILAGTSVVYQHELSRLVSTRQNLTSQLEDKSQSLKQAKSNISRLKSEKNNLTKKISDLKANLSSTIDKKNEKISQLKSDIANLKNEKSSLRNRLKKKKQNISELETEINNLKQKKTDILKDFEDVCTDTDTNLSSSSEDICESYEDDEFDEL